ncbi:MAG: pyridoxal phosphate-dependent aminotransferase [Firmicutes bacterium]|nr:pyridoxal phosphate-dependent aminotransferase [Bacillota bacterium]
MLSQRNLALGRRRSSIRELFEYGRRRKAEIGEENVFDFSIGNPSVPTPEHVGSVMRRLIDECDPVQLHGYTSAAGDAGVRAAVADNLNRRFGGSVSPDLIYMTCGAAASLTITLSAIMCEGDEVIVLTPCFPEYRVFIESAGGRVVEVPCDGDLQPDIGAMAAALTDRTKAVIINSPNNPTGAVYTRERLEGLAELLGSRKNPIYLISDEPYRELTYGEAEVPFVPSFYRRTVICYSFSKSLSLPGERIGYICVSPEMDEARDLFDAVCGAGRSLGFVCAPSLLQRTVAECLDDTADINVYRRNRDRLYTALTDMGYSAVHPDGAFYLFLKALEDDAVAFCERAKRYELLLVPSDDFGCRGYARVSYCVTPEQIERALPAFEALYNEYESEKTK